MIFSSKRNFHDKIFEVTQGFQEVPVKNQKFRR